MRSLKESNAVVYKPIVFLTSALATVGLNFYKMPLLLKEIVYVNLHPQRKTFSQFPEHKKTFDREGCSPGGGGLEGDPTPLLDQSKIFRDSAPF